MHADLILHGSVLTMDPARPRAAAVAVRGGRILAVGASADIHALAGPGTQTMELGSGCLMPGFHDAHLHLTRFGLELTQLDLAPFTDFTAALDAIQRRAAELPEGEWLLAAGFALNTWRLPAIGDAEAEALNAAAGGRSMMMESQDHHSSWVSRDVLEAAGLIDSEGRATAAARAPGVVRGTSGQPTGLLLEGARSLVADSLPAPDAQRLAKALAEGASKLASLGITTVHHMAAEPPSHARALAKAASLDDFPLRVWACVPHALIEAAADLGLATGQGGSNYQIGGAKFFVDGALGSRTAWMLEPYTGTSETGTIVDGPEVLMERVPLAAAAGLAPVVHAIGDAANRAVIDAFEASHEALATAGLRPRLEHAQHMHPDDVARAGALGVVTSMQPIHLTFDVAGIATLLADRVARAYPTRSLLRAGAKLAFGSDTPVASPDVFAGLRAACRRQGVEGGRLGAGEAISPDEALAAYTTGAAYAIEWEHRSGKLAVGYDADMVVLSHDPLVSLDGLEVLATVKGGMFTYRR